MLSYCPVCRLPSHRYVSNLPCEDCAGTLLRAPAICEVCLGLACPPGLCAKPWMRVSGEDGELQFHSVHAAYLSVGPGASILKSWKKTSGPALDAFLRQGVRESIRELAPAPRPLVLIPVPQSRERKWILGGGSVNRLGEMIAKAHPEATLLPVLTLNPALPEKTNQGRMTGDLRYSRKSLVRAVRREEWKKDPENEKRVSSLRGTDPQIFLVDDFLTSGNTLRASLAAAKEACENLALFRGRRTRISAFVLGFRPTLFH